LPCKGQGNNDRVGDLYGGESRFNGLDFWPRKHFCSRRLRIIWKSTARLTPYRRSACDPRSVGFRTNAYSGVGRAGLRRNRDGRAGQTRSRFDTIPSNDVSTPAPYDFTGRIRRMSDARKNLFGRGISGPTEASVSLLRLAGSGKALHLFWNRTRRPMIRKERRTSARSAGRFMIWKKDAKGQQPAFAGNIIPQSRINSKLDKALLSPLPTRI